jgi:hypothetical protein
VQAEADMLSDTARFSPSADAGEIVQSRAGIARKPAGCVTTQPKAPRGTNTADGFTCRVSQQTHQAVRPAASEDTRRGGRARPFDREAPEFAVRCFGDALSVANVQQLLAGYVSRTRVHPIIAARRGEHPGERDGGQADQQLMREPTKSAIFRYRLPRRREPVSAAPASWSGLGDM